MHFGNVNVRFGNFLNMNITPVVYSHYKRGRIRMNWKCTLFGFSCSSASHELYVNHTEKGVCELNSFGVNPEKLHICVESLNSTVQVLRRESSVVTSVSENLSLAYNGYERLLSQIAAQNDELVRLQQSITGMSGNLGKIASLYRNTDKDVLNSAVSIANAYEAAVAAGVFEGAAGMSLNPFSGTFLRDLRIMIQELLDPETAQKVNDFLNSGSNNQLTDEQKQQIKEKIYNAKEPYKTIYLKYLERYSIGDADVGEKKSACYRPSDKTVNYNYSDDTKDSFDDDPRGPYTVFFHESGHAVDDVADLTNVNGSDTSNFTYHSDAMGKDVTLREAIQYDVYYNKSNPHSVTSMADQIMRYNKSCQGADLNTVINAMKNGTSQSLSGANEKLFNAIRSQYESSLGNASEYEAVSDVYGGTTHNDLCHGYYHDNDYWDSRDASAPARELWAEYFSYNMADNTANLAHLREYFPEASKVCDAYANSLAA